MKIDTQWLVRILHEDSLLSAGLQAAFRSHQDFEVVCGAPHPNQRIANVIVADFDNGVRCALARAELGAPVMIVSREEGESAIREALDSGVRGYLLTRTPIDVIVSSARAVIQDGFAIDPVVASKIVSSLNADPLTKREQAVLALLTRGCTDKDMARSLGIAVGTVKCHLKQLRRKLKARTRTEAILIAQRRGLVPRAIARLGAVRACSHNDAARHHHLN